MLQIAVEASVYEYNGIHVYNMIACNTNEKSARERT